MVNLKGKSVAERAKAIIALAHPDFREDLERQAYENRLIPRGVSFCRRGNPSQDLRVRETFAR
jgi:acyl-CoA hydrolase